MELLSSFQQWWYIEPYGSTTLSGGLRTRTDNIDQSEEQNFAGYTGLTARRTSRNIGAASSAIDFSGSTTRTVDGVTATVTRTNVDVTLGGSSGRDITIPAGNVDFTMTIGSEQNRTEGLFDSGTFDFTGLSTSDLQPIVGNGRPRPGGNGLGTAFAGWFIPSSSATITVRVTGTLTASRTWTSRWIGFPAVNQQPPFSLVNNPVYSITFSNANPFAISSELNHFSRRG